MKRWLGLAFALTTMAVTARAQSNAFPTITTHDNVRPAGRFENGALSVSLYAGIGRWYPEGPASARNIEALGEEGQPLMVPSPLIRAASGTIVNVSIRNALASPIRVHGLCDRPGTCEPLTIAAGTTGQARFKLNTPGTFHYWATTTNVPLALRDGADSQLGGAIVADGPGVDPRERIFVIGMLRKESRVVGTEILAVNGRSWPHNERLRHAVGDTVRWRVVNLTDVAHAMHLHGFYFNVDATGDGTSETRLADGSKAVTQRVTSGGTLAMSWVPERPGNWLFHCHMLEHMMPNDHSSQVPTHQAPDSAAGMAGLVMGVHVTGPDRRVAIPDSARRKFQLTINPDTRLGDVPSYKVELTQAGVSAPRINERAAPGPVLVVTRGQPVAVEILNHLNEPTAIHWHGIELESYDDGVPNFGGGGSSGSITPPVAPHGSFTARFTPPRAGTFIYHSHWHNAAQLSGGIYGPLVVLEPGQRYDPVSDHIVMFGLEGKYRPIPNEAFAVNGEAEPRALELKAGIPHRLRFINITGDGVNLTTQLLSIHDPIRWTLLAKDGADVPPSIRTMRQARQQIAVGETYDFELAPMTPRAEGYWLELRRGSGELLIQWPVRVR